MELLEPRKELGVVVRGSLSKGLEVKLDPHRSIEELRAGRFVVVEGREYDYFSMITDISLGATNPEVLDTPPDRDDALMQAVLTGTSTFGTVSLRPMIQLPRSGVQAFRRSGVQGPTETGLPLTLPDPERLNARTPERPNAILPVKSIPPHFSPVMEATAADVSRVFGDEEQDPRYFRMGAPLDMEEVSVCLDLDRFVERSNGIFGKSGTGKTFLTRIALCGLIRGDHAVNLVFDMHSEYGWQGTSEGAHRRSVRGLRQYFDHRVAVFTLDPDSSRRRGAKVDFHVQIPYTQVTVEDVVLLQDELNLTPTAAETAYALVNAFGRDWFGKLLELDTKQFCEEHNVHEGALAALKRKLSVLARECDGFLRPQVTDDAVDRILSDLERGTHVVIEFGQYRHPKQYMLVANLLTRRIHERYVERKERSLGGGEPEPRPLVITIEEAHKFLSPSLAGQTIFGTIAREMRKYNVTLLVVDQRPSGIDTEVLSQLGTKITCLLDDDRDIDAVLAGTSGASSLRGVLASLETKQQALILGHAVPMPVVIHTREYDTDEFARSMGVRSEAERAAEEAELRDIFA
jgi:DNA helicase HerA-like ATPase